MVPDLRILEHSFCFLFLYIYISVYVYFSLANGLSRLIFHMMSLIILFSSLSFFSFGFRLSLA